MDTYQIYVNCYWSTLLCNEFLFQTLTYIVSSFLVHMKVRHIFRSFIFIKFYGLSNSKSWNIVSPFGKRWSHFGKPCYYNHCEDKKNEQPQYCKSIPSSFKYWWQFKIHFAKRKKMHVCTVIEKILVSMPDHAP